MLRGDKSLFFIRVRFYFLPESTKQRLNLCASKNEVIITLLFYFQRGYYEIKDGAAVDVFR